MNIKVISQYQFVCTRLSSAHTPTRKLVGVWALDKLVHTNRYCEITYNIIFLIFSMFFAMFQLRKYLVWENC